MKLNIFFLVVSLAVVNLSFCQQVGFTIQNQNNNKQIPPQEQVGSQDEIIVWLNGLCGENEEGRQTAKEMLLQAGSKAVPTLISILEDKKNTSLPDCSTLRNDSVELLGLLRAEDAIPILVRRMSTDGIVLRKKNEEVKALTNIGAAAVPLLIEVIEMPDETLASPNYWLGAAFKDSDNPRAFRFIPRLIKSRAIMVLGKIGDSRALPVIEKVQEISKDKDIVESAKDAINMIKKSKTL